MYSMAYVVNNLKKCYPSNVEYGFNAIIFKVSIFYILGYPGHNVDDNNWILYQNGVSIETFRMRYRKTYLYIKNPTPTPTKVPFWGISECGK